MWRFLPIKSINKMTTFQNISADPKTILLAEDDNGLRSLITKYLEKMRYHVLPVESGELALEFLKEGNNIKLLLTDVILKGGITGPELVDRALSYNKSLRFVFMSGYPKEFLFRKGLLRNESQHVLLKPFSSKDLEVIVTAELAST